MTVPKIHFDIQQPGYWHDTGDAWYTPIYLDGHFMCLYLGPKTFFWGMPPCLPAASLLSTQFHHPGPLVEMVLKRFATYVQPPKIHTESCCVHSAVTLIEIEIHRPDLFYWDSCSLPPCEWNACQNCSPWCAGLQDPPKAPALLGPAGGKDSEWES